MVKTAPRLPPVELISVKSVRYAGDHKLRLRFSDGVEGIADLSTHLRGRVFEPLRDPAFFARVELQDGYTAAWPNDVDIAPEFLYDLTVLSRGSRVAKRNLQRAFDAAAKEYAVQCDRMPEISRFCGIIIRMFYDEHALPRFHARSGGDTVTVNIRDGAVKTHGFPPDKVSLVLEWRAQHRRELLKNWDRMRRDEDPLPIAPLE